MKWLNLFGHFVQRRRTKLYSTMLDDVGSTLSNIVQQCWIMWDPFVRGLFSRLMTKQMLDSVGSKVCWQSTSASFHFLIQHLLSGRPNTFNFLNSTMLAETLLDGNV